MPPYDTPGPPSDEKSNVGIWVGVATSSRSSRSTPTGGLVFVIGLIVAIVGLTKRFG